MPSLKEMCLESTKTLMPEAQEVFESYKQKDANTNDVTWLTDVLVERFHGNVAREEAQKYAQEIVEHVNRFSDNMESIERTCAAGGTKEEWLRKYLNENCVGEDVQQSGEYLNEVNTRLKEGNKVLVEAIQNPDAPVSLEKEQNLPVATSGTQWNKFTLAKTEKEIGEQAIVAGNTGLDVAIRVEEELASEAEKNGEENPLDDLDDIKDDSTLDRGLSMALSAVTFVGSVFGTVGYMFPAFAPLSVIVPLSCWGIQTLRCANLVRRGKMNIIQAMEYSGRAAISSIASVAASFFSGQIFEKASGFFRQIPIISTVFDATGPALKWKAKGALKQGLVGNIENVLTVAFDKVKSGLNKVGSIFARIGAVIKEELKA